MKIYKKQEGKNNTGFLITVNSRSFLLILLFACLANILPGQENDISKKHRVAWTEVEYVLRYEVIIEKEDDNEYSTVLQEFTEEPFIYFSLPPGNYRLRVIPYDFRDLPGKGSKWKKFTILDVADTEPQLVMEDQTSPPSKNNNLFIALFAEGSGYTRRSTAFGGGIAFGWNFNGKGIGISLSDAQDGEQFMFLEALAHFRYYLAFLTHAKINTGLFLQAEGGIVFFGHERLSNHLLPVAGLSAGWRFPLGTNFFLEPAVRGGWPYIFGASLSAGMRFQ